jgi:xanthine dehydrogenase accessory factor
MSSWLQKIPATVASYGAAVRVLVVRSEGSVPREAGAGMIVTSGTIDGTIGGGALELDAINTARSILRKAEHEPFAAWWRDSRDYPLGPSLGQCCGGYVKVLFELFTRAETAELFGWGVLPDAAAIAVRSVETGTPIRIISHRKDGYDDLPLQVIRLTRDMLSGARPLSPAYLHAAKHGTVWFIEPLRCSKTPLFLYGAGHVGRAVVNALSGLPFEITWADTGRDRFPPGISKGDGLTPVVTGDPPAVARIAPGGAFHLVMTYSHPLDLAICHEVLRNGTFAYLGLIGSATKRARFIKRLRELGHGESALGRLTCPVGVPGITGKEPAIIAISVAAQLLQKVAARGSNSSSQREGAAP